MEVGGEKRPFLGMTDLPLYGRGPGWLKACSNLRVMPGGYLEARGGFEALKPTSGTASDPLVSGIFTGAHEHTMADGYLFKATSGGTVFTENLAQRGYFTIWPTTFETVEEDAFYIGSDQKFSRVVFYIGQGGFAALDAPDFSYEFPTTSDWVSYSDLTTTSTPDFASTGEQVLEFADPSTWVRSVRNGVYAYFVRIRISDLNGGVITAVNQTTQKVYSDWVGAREIYVSGADASTGTDNGVLKRWGQSSATMAANKTIASDLFSGNYARARFASYKNILYMVNGKDQKRWDGFTLEDLGFPVPTSSDTNDKVVSILGGLTGLFKYAVTYGYGPAGEWGESNELQLDDTGALADKEATYTLNLTSIPAQAEKIYVYRTTDLTSVPASATAAFPMFRIQTLDRASNSQFPESFTDTTLAFPFPPIELDITENQPPVRCKYIAVHKNRLFIGGNNQFPGRVWWSPPFGVEAFNKDEDYADFTRSTGGQLTGIIDFNDQVVCFTEDKTFGIANVDQDQPSIYEIAHIGCIAPDSVKSSFGFLCWLARNGVYVWDGTNPPQRVSDHTSFTFGKMSLEKFGGSRAEIHGRQYDIYMIDSANAEAATARWRYDLVTKTWCQVSLGVTAKWGPLAVVTAPPGHADAGVRHVLYGQCALPASDFAAYFGEYTTQDNGTNFSCSADVHFGPIETAEIEIEDVYAHYAGVGWASQALSNPAQLTYIGGTAGAFANMTADGGLDYTRLRAVPEQGTLGTADVIVRFTATTNGAGSANGQRLLAVGITGGQSRTQWGK